jgi:Uma2 family endonuclease
MALTIPKLPLTNEEFERLCEGSDYQLERTKEGAIIMHPPAGLDSGSSNGEIITQLRNWWKQHRKGKTYDCNTGFFLPDGSTPRSPDAAYATSAQVGHLTPEQRRHFGYFVPAFIIELRSATDSLDALKRKMTDTWLANGMQLGWLIDPDKRNVWVYEAGREPRVEAGLHVVGSGPVEGFALSLAEVWQEYE